MGAFDKFELKSIATKMSQDAPIPFFKKDWRLCFGGFCCNQYCISCDSCVSSQLRSCMCCGSDMSCLPIQDNIPQLCGLVIPGLICYPKCGCCQPLSEYFDGPELEKFGEKKDLIVCGGCCFWCGACNNYCFSPCKFGCCADNGSTCLCIAQDCSFPCTSTIPNTCGGCICPGMMCMPGFGCCPTVGELFPKNDWEATDGKPDMQDYGGTGTA